MYQFDTLINLLHVTFFAVEKENENNDSGIVVVYLDTDMSFANVCLFYDNDSFHICHF